MLGRIGFIFPQTFLQIASVLFESDLFFCHKIIVQISFLISIVSNYV